MRYYQDLSFKEIADITGVSINTALGRMRYAILNMRRMAEETVSSCRWLIIKVENLFSCHTIRR